jgi:hypothetical protein
VITLGRHARPLRGSPFDGAPPWVRFRIKEWSHFALVADELMLTVAVVDAKYLQLAWCQLVDRRTGHRFEERRQTPFLSARVSVDLWNDRSFARARGFSLELDDLLEEGHHRIRAEVQAGAGHPALSADVRAEHPLETNRPLIVALPLSKRRIMYSHKSVLEASGSIRIGEESIRLDPSRTFAILDFHKAQYPHHTWWRWATFAARDGEGRLIGLNATHNVVDDDARYNENGFWCDGTLHPLGPFRFRVDPTRLDEPWEISSLDDRARLQFRLQGRRHEDLNLGLVRSKFSQCYGTFSGVVHTDGGVHRIEDAFGLAEVHDSLW